MFIQTPKTPFWCVLILFFLLASCATTSTMTENSVQGSKKGPKVVDIPYKKEERPFLSKNYLQNVDSYQPPSGTKYTPQKMSSSFRSVALLLPISGEGFVGEVSQAIVRGFKEESQRSKKHLYFKIKIYDTTKTSPKELYKKAVTEGSSLVIGPLLPMEEESILHSYTRLPVPMLSLVFHSKPPSKKGLFSFFGLSSENEGAAMAHQMIKEGQYRVLIYKQNAPWAERQTQAFIEQYNLMGGHVLRIITDDTKFTKEKQVSALLGVERKNISEYKKIQDKIRAAKRKITDEAQLKSIVDELYQDLKDIGRKDGAQAIYLLADDQLAKSLRPFVAYYLGADLRVYGTSRGIPSQARDFRNLEGVIFPVFDGVEFFVANKNAPFLALGADLYKSIPWILSTNNTQEPYFFSGALGSYISREDGRVLRTPKYLQIKRGGWKTPVDPSVSNLK